MASILVELPASKSSILYCSRSCAKQDGWDYDVMTPIKPEEYERNRESYGALCPMCEREYEEF